MRFYFPWKRLQSVWGDLQDGNCEQKRQQMCLSAFCSFGILHLLILGILEIETFCFFTLIFQWDCVSPLKIVVLPRKNTGSYFIWPRATEWKYVWFLIPVSAAGKHSVTTTAVTFELQRAYRMFPLWWFGSWAAAPTLPLWTCCTFTALDFNTVQLNPWKATWDHIGRLYVRVAMATHGEDGEHPSQLLCCTVLPSTDICHRGTRGGGC